MIISGRLETNRAAALQGLHVEYPKAARVCVTIPGVIKWGPGSPLAIKNQSLSVLKKRETKRSI